MLRPGLCSVVGLGSLALSFALAVKAEWSQDGPTDAAALRELSRFPAIGERSSRPASPPPVVVGLFVPAIQQRRQPWVPGGGIQQVPPNRLTDTQRRSLNFMLPNLFSTLNFMTTSYSANFVFVEDDATDNSCGPPNRPVTFHNLRSRLFLFVGVEVIEEADLGIRVVRPSSTLQETIPGFIQALLNSDVTGGVLYLVRDILSARRDFLRFSWYVAESQPCTTSTSTTRAPARATAPSPPPPPDTPPATSQIPSPLPPRIPPPPPAPAPPLLDAQFCQEGTCALVRFDQMI